MFLIKHKKFELNLNLTVPFVLLVLICGCAGTSMTSYQTPSKPEMQTQYTVSHRTQEVLSKKTKVFHTIARGDTLWSISRKFNVNIADLAEENNITRSTTLKAGQVLSIPLARIHKGNKTLFSWPLKGTIISYFGEKIDNRLNQGIEIKADKNTPVKSAAAGKITFVDSLKGYGNTVIIEHSRDLATIYTNLNKVCVTKNQQVSKGEAIGEIGKDLERGIYVLHFEVRNRCKAENPLCYLAQN